MKYKLASSANHLSSACVGFGKNLRALRLKKGLTQGALGELCGLSIGVAAIRINRYEKGVHHCPDELLVPLAHVLDVSITSFFIEEDSVLGQVIDLFHHADEEKQQDLLETIRSFNKEHAPEGLQESQVLVRYSHLR